MVSSTSRPSESLLSSMKHAGTHKKKPSGLDEERGRWRGRNAESHWQSTLSVLPRSHPLSPLSLVREIPECYDYRTPTHRPSSRHSSPRKLILLNSCVVAGRLPGGGRLDSKVGVRQVGGAASEVTRHGEHKIRLISSVETGGLLFRVLVAHLTQSKGQN